MLKTNQSSALPKVNQVCNAFNEVYGSLIVIVAKVACVEETITVEDLKI